MLLLPPGSALETAPQDLTALLLRSLYARLPSTHFMRDPVYRRQALAPSIFGASPLGR